MYRLVVDHRGSARGLVDVATGDVPVQGRWFPFGERIVSPQLMIPFGYAGGPTPELDPLMLRVQPG